MEYEKALELSKDEFLKMAEFQDLLLNINDENFDKVQEFINLNFDFNNHSSVQKFCHMLGSIISIRPHKQIYLKQLFNNHKEKIESIIKKNEIKFYSIFSILKNLEQKQNEEIKDLQLKEQEKNNLKLLTYIENDNLELFQTFLFQTNTKTNAKIEQKNFYSHQTIHQIELIEYSALCGSLNIFKFLLNQIQEFPIKLKNFAVAGGNYEIIHILEQSSNNFKGENKKAFLFDQETLEIAIEFHRNDLIEYLIDSSELHFDSKSLYFSIISNNFILLNKYIQNEKLFNDFYQLILDDFISITHSNSIAKNISFIEFAIKIKNDQNELKNYIYTIVYYNYDSVAHCLTLYRSEMKQEIEIFVNTVFNLFQHQLFDAMIVFIKFFNEFPENQPLIQEIFECVSSSDNELLDTILNFDNISFNNEYSPLFPAIRENNLNFIQKLLKNKKIDVNSINPMVKISPLIFAYEKKKMEIFECLLNDVNVDVNKKDLRNGETVLHHACFDNNFECVKMLIDIKKDSLDLNVKNNLNQTPLHLAAIENNVEIVELLIKSGKADIQIKDKSGVFFLFLFFY